MNLLPSLVSIFDELTQRFGAQIEHAHAPQPNELYLHAKRELAGALCSTFYKKYDGRLAGVFAEDARAEHDVFFVYYLYALDSKHAVRRRTGEYPPARLLPGGLPATGNLLGERDLYQILE